MISFNEMNIADEIKTALEDMGFSSPTPVQQEVIPLVLENKDVIAQAPTGTGKTCAFGIPVINNIDVSAEEVQALILCPTRELVIQTENELKEVSKYSKDIKIVSIYGGQNIDRQLSGLRKKPQIVIGTTGRIMDHLRRKSLKLAGMKTLILDEVDEMLNMGFREDIDVILETVPKERQTILFSATMPKEIVEISRLYQIEPLSVKTTHKESEIPNINQYYVNVGEAEKIGALVSLMKEKKYFLALVFCNTKKRVDELSSRLAEAGFNADALHGDLKQRERDRTMKKFRSGETQVLIATDVAARGIDVDNIEAVFNFDAPHDEEYYVHRIGRTARANKAGDAYTFVSDKQMYIIKNFERYTKSTINKTGYSKELTELGIDKKLFDKTLKLIKRGDLTTFKEFLEEQLDEFKQKYDETEMIDIAAALLMQINEIETNKNATLSEAPPRLAKSSQGGRVKGGVRFFMNIGLRDNCDSDYISRMISSKANIDAQDILDVYCLENFSFATVSEGNNDAMDSLNGLKINKRVLAVEEAAGEKRTGRKPAGREGRDSREGREGRDNRDSREGRDNRASRDGSQSDNSDRPFKKSFNSDRPFKKPFKSGESFKKSFNSERPFKKFSNRDGEMRDGDTSQNVDGFKPFDKSFDRPFRKDAGERSARPDRPFRKEGFGRDDFKKDGFRKDGFSRDSFKKDGFSGDRSRFSDKPRSSGPSDKPWAKTDAPTRRPGGSGFSDRPARPRSPQTTFRAPRGK